jgi:hypothetical protein
MYGPPQSCKRKTENGHLVCANVIHQRPRPIGAVNSIVGVVTHVDDAAASERCRPTTSSGLQVGEIASRIQIDAPIVDAAAAGDRILQLRDVRLAWTVRQ